MRYLLSVLVAVLLASPMCAHAQPVQPSPAMDYARFLRPMFYPNRGTFFLGTSPRDIMVFPPSDRGESAEMAYLLRDEQGTVVLNQTIRSVSPSRQHSVFAEIESSPEPMMEGLQDGVSYTLDVVMDEAVISRIPFTVSVAMSNDPFNPQSTWTLDGPWRTHAYLEYQEGKPDGEFEFTAWVESRDVPGRSSSTEVSIRRDGVEVAWGHNTVALGLNRGWGFASHDLLKPGGRTDNFARQASRTKPFTYEDMTEVPGTYEVVLSSESGPIRTFTVEVGPDGIVPHPRSDLNADRATFLSPRRMGDRSFVYHTFWMVNE